jgi:putative ABC transport system permease protein
MDPINTAPFDPSRDLTQIWYPVDLAAMDGSQAGLVLSQLRGATAKTHDLPTAAEQDQPAGSIQSLTLTAGIVPSLEQALDRIGSARSVLLVAAIGPLGAVIAVVALGLGAFAERRRATVAALATRGGSPGQVRGLLAADGLLVGLVPALLAVGLAWWVFGPDLSVTGAVLAGVAGLVPAAFLAATPIGATVRRTRPDAGIRTRNRYRWVAELSVLALAGVSVYLLYSAGLQTQSSGVGLDVLVAAAPLLLAAAACVVVFRLYPLPLRVVSGHYRRGRSAVGFLGSLRALRDPAVGVAPVLAVVVGVSVAVFSAVTLTTLDDGIEAAAVSAVGADLRVDSLAVSDSNLAAVSKLPGVAAAARFQLVGSESVTIPGRPAPVTVDVYVADTAALAEVQAHVAGAVVVPPGMADAAPPAVIVSSDLAADIAGANGAFEPGAPIDVDGADAQVVATSDHLTGLGQSVTWLLGDATAGTPSKLGTFRPTTMLVSLTPGADPLAVTNEITTVLDSVISTSTPVEAVAVATADPIVSGLRVALIAALAAAGAVLLTMLLGTARRIRMLALLRVLGMSVRQRRVIVIWEQAPTVVASLLVGAGLGVALTAVVRSVVDLRPFTAGVIQPDLSVGAGLLVVLLGGFILMVAWATAVGLLLTRRTGIAAIVRVDEE